MIESILIKNYRNIKNINIEFWKSETLFIWQNWQWKTSILEAIFFLSIWKAYRAKHWTEAINFEEDFSIIEWEIMENLDSSINSEWQKNTNSKVQNLFIWFQTTPRKQINFKVNWNKKKIIDFIWNFSAVLFSPEDLRIISDAPQNRRSFLDSLLIRIDKKFAFDLNNYQKIVKQRNALLKKINEWKLKIEQLNIWDEQLINFALLILEKRVKLIEDLKSQTSSFYKIISKKNKKMTIEYYTNLDEISKEWIRKKLKERIQRDLILWSTSVWPHRDDLKIYLDWKEMKEFASQWEIRTWILSLKYSEIEILKKKTENITLLLDDVFSELDEERQKSLIELSKEYQTIITSTHMPEWLSWEKIIKIKNWEIE